eukprot:10962000-Ditylum_brightwellii.AAC.1
MLVLPQNGIQYQITQAKEQYYDELHQFNACNTIEKILIQKIVYVIDAKYLTAIRDPVMHHITLTIPDILDHLFDNYGDVTAKELRELHNLVEKLSYQSTEPVDTIFTEINTLSEVAKIAKRSLSEEQKVDMAYLLLQNKKVQVRSKYME